MAFSNETIKQKHRFLVAPHIVKIEGFWRVSPRTHAVFGSPHYERWNDAHEFVSALNYKLSNK